MTIKTEMNSQVESGSVSWSEVLNRQYGAALALVCMGVWLHAAESLLVATMIPAIVAEIDGTVLVAWTVMLYEIGTIVAGATGALLAIRHGIRLSMGVAALAYAVGSAVAALAPSMEVLLLGRLFQGLGGGGLVALSFIAVGMLFPSRLTPRVVAAISTLWGASSLLGPLIGGLFVEFSTWRYGFWFFAAQAAVLAIWIGLGVKISENPTDQTKFQRLPLLRLSILAAGVVLVAYGGIDVGVTRTSALILAGIFCLIVFIWLDGREVDNRLLPRRPFNLRAPEGAALTMILCFAAASTPLFIYGPLLLTSLHGMSALAAGYTIAALSAGWTIVALMVSGVPERHDPRYIATGMLLVTVSVLGLAYAVPHGPIWLVVVFAVVQGGGFGMAWTFLLRQATNFAPTDDKQRIAGAIPTVQRLGYALGAAIIGIVANSAGFAEAVDRVDIIHAGMIIFAACFPIAILGLIAMTCLVSANRAIRN